MRREIIITSDYWFGWVMDLVVEFIKSYTNVG